MNEAQVKALLVYLDVGMRILSVRILTLISLLMAFSLFAWVMYLPDEWRLGSAVAFSVLVLFQIVSLDKREMKPALPNQENQA